MLGRPRLDRAVIALPHSGHPTVVRRARLVTGRESHLNREQWRLTNARLHPVESWRPKCLRAGQARAGARRADLRLIGRLPGRSAAIAALMLGSSC